ncbi:lamin tail domain-containing protein, partial [Streptomyces sp. NPDC005055]
HTGRGHDTRTNVYQDRRTDYVWSNYSDTATLRDNHGRTIDTKSWGRDRDHRNNDRDHRNNDRDHRNNDRDHRNNDRDHRNHDRGHRR